MNAPQYTEFIVRLMLNESVVRDRSAKALGKRLNSWNREEWKGIRHNTLQQREMYTLDNN